jgi:hypothetical protein
MTTSVGVSPRKEQLPNRLRVGVRVLNVHVKRKLLAGYRGNLSKESRCSLGSGQESEVVWCLDRAVAIELTRQGQRDGRGDGSGRMMVGNKALDQCRN